MTLHRWAEHEADGRIQREGDDGEGKPRWHSALSNGKGYPIADRERGALNRLGKIVGDCNTRNWIGYGKCITEMPAFLVAYHQGDPRGCALYIGLKSDLDGKPIDSCYSRLVAVCD